MSPAQLNTTIAAMRNYGGAFVVRLADLIAIADHENEARLLSAFPDYVKRYGPGSEPFAMIQKQKVAA